MARFIGNQGGSGSYPTTASPSAVDGPPADQFAPRSAFKTDENIHRHASPLGERSQKALSPYEAGDPAMGQRSGKKVDPYRDDRNYRLGHEQRYSCTDGYDLYSGKLSKGQEYADRKFSHDSDWDSKTGKSKGAGFEPGNAGRTGMGKSG